MQLTIKEIEEFKHQLEMIPEALEVMNLIEENNGDLDLSTKLILIAEDSDEMSDRSMSEFTEKLAQKFKHIICQEEFSDDLMSGLLTAAISYIAVNAAISIALATPIVIYLSKTGIRNFCTSRD